MTRLYKRLKMPHTRKKTGRKAMTPSPEAVTEVEVSQVVSEIHESVKEWERTKPSPETVTEFEEPLPPAVQGTYKKARTRSNSSWKSSEEYPHIILVAPGIFLSEFDYQLFILTVQHSALQPVFRPHRPLLLLLLLLLLLFCLLFG